MRSHLSKQSSTATDATYANGSVARRKYGIPTSRAKSRSSQHLKTSLPLHRFRSRTHHLPHRHVREDRFHGRVSFRRAKPSCEPAQSKKLTARHRRGEAGQACSHKILESHLLT